MRIFLSIVTLFLLEMFALPLRAGQHQPVIDVVAADKPNDGGKTLIIKWKNVDTGASMHEVFRIKEGEKTDRAQMIGKAKAHTSQFVDSKAETQINYRYFIKTGFEDGTTLDSQKSLPVASEASWFNTNKLANIIAVLIFTALFFFLMWRVRKGTSIYIRPIAGLMALNDAVGRAAEMGRPILFSPGLQSVGNPATIAAMSMLGEVAKKAARLRTRTKVPNYDALTWPVTQSVVKDAFEKAGRAEDYRAEDVNYAATRFLAYATAVAGMMVREKTASNFLIGHFYSESLILAETGAATGAVQIGGTDSEAQLPFFITTCDYVLIGEELFAAAALVDEDPVNRSTIAVHDWFKIGAMILMLTGLVLGLLQLAGIEGAAGIAKKIGEALVESK